MCCPRELARLRPSAVRVRIGRFKSIFVVGAQVGSFREILPQQPIGVLVRDERSCRAVSLRSRRDGS